GLVRIVDEDRCAALFADKFEPPFGAAQCAERRKHRSSVTARRYRETGSDQCVFDLKLADQRQTHLKAPAALLDGEPLRKTIDRRFDKANAGSGASDRHHSCAARRCGGHHRARMVVINLNNRGARWLKQILKQPQLGVEIVLKARMIIEMVAR